MKNIFYFLFICFLYCASYTQAANGDINIINYLVLSYLDDSTGKGNQDVTDAANDGGYSESLINQFDDAPDYLLNLSNESERKSDDTTDSPDGLFSKGGRGYEKIKEEKSKWYDQTRFKIDWEFTDKTDELFIKIYDASKSARTHILTIGKEKYTKKKQIICNVKSNLTHDQVKQVDGIGEKIIDKIKGSYFYVYLIALEQPIDSEQDDTLPAAPEIGEKGKGKVYKQSTEMGNNLEELVDKADQLELKEKQELDPSGEKLRKIYFYLDIAIRK